MKKFSFVFAACILLGANTAQAQSSSPTIKKALVTPKSSKNDTGVATTNGMSNDPRCVMTDGMNGGGDINCFEDNPGDWGSNTYYTNDFEFNYLMNKLERVTVVGNSAIDIAGLCIDGMCTAYQSLQDVKLELQNVGFWDNHFSPPPIPAPACSPLVPPSARGITSRDEFQDRQIAAGQIMLFTQAYNQIGNNGKVFIVYYADGGSELWQYTSGNPARPIPKGELKPGDGVSKCP